MSERAFIEHYTANYSINIGSMIFDDNNKREIEIYHAKTRETIHGTSKTDALFNMNDASNARAIYVAVFWVFSFLFGINLSSTKLSYQR